MAAPVPASAHAPNLLREHGFESLEVEGRLPEGLAGTLYRCGPGLMERFGVTLPHPFEADGMIVAVRLDGRGGAEGAARIITSADYHEEQAAGRFLYSAPAPWSRRFANGLRGKIKNTGNTRAWTRNGQVFALMEAAKPIAIDPATLDVLGEDDFDGAVVRSFSAHPHRIAGDPTVINFGQRYGKQTMLDVYALPDGGRSRRLASVPTSWPGMVHDFILTEDYAVFFNCPGKLALGRALLQIGDFASWLRWQPSLGTEILVVPLAEPERFRRFETEPFWVWHFANAFQDGGEIVIDYCRYPDLGSLAAIGKRDPSVAPPLLHRARLDPQTGRFRSEQRWDHVCEFPRVAPHDEARPYRHVFLRVGSEDEGRGVARLDVESGVAELWQSDELLATEPVPAVPADGSLWITSLCHDRKRGRSCLAILDGEHIDAGPVARLYFDQPLPQTFHGDWAQWP